MFNTLRNSLDKIKAKQRLINSYWDESTNEDLIGFYARVVANISDAERCSIFIYNPEADTLWLKTGTDLQKPKIEVPKETIFGVVEEIDGETYRLVQDQEIVGVLDEE